MSDTQHTTSHPLWVRWAHWINFPVLTIMIWSGMMIYWANDIYWPDIPDSIYQALHLNGHLAEGLSYHFFFMWIFAVNGILYFLYIMFSGEWREIFPQKSSFRGAFEVVLHDLGISKKPLPPTKFNHAQRFAYTAVVFMGLGSLVTGLAIYKPIQLSWLKNFEGGYESARLIHYLLTVGYILFFFVHIAQVIRAGWNNFAAMVGKTKLAYVTLAAGMIVGLSAFMAARQAGDDNGVPWPFRRVLDFNARIWSTFLKPERVETARLKPPPPGKQARMNGDLGLNSELDLANWKLTVNSAGSAPKELTITLDDLKKLPRTEVLTQFKCIEGWSEVMTFAGVRFIDFLEHYHLGTHSGETPDWKGRRDDLFAHVGLETPDEEYYVSVDMKSMLNPQTLLAYEQNGLPLTPGHGAPLRLYIPNKYGVKSLKRIGKIVFSDSRLPDYWGEQGYDWFIGL